VNILLLNKRKKVIELKIAGCVLVITICMLIGRTMAAGYVARVNNLREFITALSLLRSRIAFGQEVLEISFSDIAGACENKVGRIFGDVAEELKSTNIPVSEIWENKIEEYFRGLDFNFNDEKILIDFGNLLGRGSVDEEVRNINLAVERLKTQLENATDEKNKYAKLYRTIGGIGGTALAIILI